MSWQTERPLTAIAVIQTAKGFNSLDPLQSDIDLGSTQQEQGVRKVFAGDPDELLPVDWSPS